MTGPYRELDADAGFNRDLERRTRRAFPAALLSDYGPHADPHALLVNGEPVVRFPPNTSDHVEARIRITRTLPQLAFQLVEVHAELKRRREAERT